MLYFIITFAFFIIVILLMSLGYIVKKKSIQGSCGGLGSLGIEKACDCPEPCDKRKAKIAAEQARLNNLAQQKRIL